MQLNSVMVSAILAATASAAATPKVDATHKVNASSSSGPTFFNGTCTPETVTVRREWRSLSDPEKAAYIAAQKCAMELPAESGLKNTTSRFSDLQASHQGYTNTEYGDIIHYVGQFLPWHRMMMHGLETIFRDQCNYTGPMVWWDEKLDADSGNFFSSNMWDSVTGFGGNGSEPDGCLTTGPFANITEHIGPMLEYTDYCMKRIWDNEEGIVTGNSTIIDMCNAMDTYDDFWYCIAVYPHHGAHTAVGGLMADKDASPGDPTFYLHHNYIDRLWWQWQQADGANRLYAISGNTVNETLNTEPAGGWVNTTLDYVLQLSDIIPDVTISEVMNAQGGYLCYEYDY